LQHLVVASKGTGLEGNAEKKPSTGSWLEIRVQDITTTQRFIINA